jgi:hypothetical protein
MNGVDFYELAKQLRSPPESSARLRTAVSRCYYGLFNEAESFLRGVVRVGELSGKAEDHDRVPRLLARLGGSAGEDVADALKSLLLARFKADYLNKCRDDTEFRRLVDPAFANVEAGFAALRSLSHSDVKTLYDQLNSVGKK